MATSGNVGSIMKYVDAATDRPNHPTEPGREARDRVVQPEASLVHQQQATAQARLHDPRPDAKTECLPRPGSAGHAGASGRTAMRCILPIPCVLVHQALTRWGLLWPLTPITLRNLPLPACCIGARRLRTIRVPTAP